MKLALVSAEKNGEWYGYSGKKFLFKTDEVTFDEAQTNCFEASGRLVEIGGDHEGHFLHTILSMMNTIESVMPPHFFIGESKHAQ